MKLYVFGCLNFGPRKFSVLPFAAANVPCSQLFRKQTNKKQKKTVACFCTATTERTIYN